MNRKTISLTFILYLTAAGFARADSGNPYTNMYHDWNKGSQARELGQSNYPTMSATQIPPKVVDPYPHDEYNYSMFPQGHPGAQTQTTTYVELLPGSRNFPVGSYLPKNIHWNSLDNYAVYGLPAPQPGQRWVASGHDVVLISEATSKILGGVTLP